MRKEVGQLALTGTISDEVDEPTDVLTDKYVDSLGKITKSIILDEAYILIKLLPPVALYGIKWTLLHLAESMHPETEFIRYKELIDERNSVEFREMLTQRPNNS